MARTPRTKKFALSTKGKRFNLIHRRTRHAEMNDYIISAFVLKHNMLKYDFFTIVYNNFESKQRNFAMFLTLQEDADKVTVERKRERPQWFSRFGHT